MSIINNLLHEPTPYDCGDSTNEEYWQALRLREKQEQEERMIEGLKDNEQDEN